MKISLAVFDFDGTIIHTLDDVTGKVIYEEATGIPWVIDNDEKALKYGFAKGFRRIGWWGRVETLLPPILERPVSHRLLDKEVYLDWVRCKNDPNVHKVLITGRHSKLKTTVEEILYELSVDLDDFFYKSMQPYCFHPEYKGDTPGWKMFAIRECAMKPEYTNLEIWEDRADVVELFKTQLIDDFKNRWQQLQVVVIHDVKTRRDYRYKMN